MPEIFGAALMGGGSGPAYAAISVTYPAGATCTCSMDGKTFTAQGTSGQALFIVPCAGEWVVTATNGSKTRSITVNVTEPIAYSVTLSFELIIYDNGTLAAGAVGVKGEYAGAGTKSKTPTLYSTSPAIHFGYTGTVENYEGGFGFCYINSPFDFTEYNTLHVIFKLPTVSTGYNGYMQIRPGSNLSDLLHSSTAYKQYNSVVSNYTEGILDISNLSGNYYFASCVYCEPVDVYFNKIWLE